MFEESTDWRDPRRFRASCPNLNASSSLSIIEISIALARLARGDCVARFGGFRPKAKEAFPHDSHLRGRVQPAIERIGGKAAFNSTFSVGATVLEFAP